MANKVFTVNDYNELKRKVNIANKRIQRIQARYGEGSWAIAGLYKKIDNKQINGISSLTGNIRINKTMSDVQLRAIQRATEDFLSPETTTSKLTGIRQAIEKTKNKLKATYGDQFETLSDEEADKLYSLVEEKTFREKTEQLDPSKVWARLVQAKRQNLSSNQFINLFDNIADIKDESVREYLREIYDKYMQ